MFIALELPPLKSKGIFGAIHNILKGPKARLDEAEALNARFLILRAFTKNNAPQWEEIARLAGRFADQVLLPDGIQPPEDSGITGIRCPRFEEQVLLRTACKIIELTRMPMYRRVAGLIDGGGDYTELLFELLHHYTSVRVVTDNMKKYAAAAEKMMERLGAPVLVGDRLSMLGECVLVLAPGSVHCDHGERPPCLTLVGNGSLPPPGWDVVTGLEAMPPELADCCPAGISLHRFAGALFEYCDLSPSDFAAVEMLHNYKNVDLMEVVRAVIYAAGVPRL